MLHFIKRIFKRKPRREYLYDEFAPQKSYLVIWVQRLILFIVLVTIGTFILTLNSLANASENSSDFYHVNMNQVSQGSLLVQDSSSHQYRQLPLLNTEVSMHVSGMIVRSHVKQRFKNNSNNHIEAVYVFPLPETAAVDHMRMEIGQRIIEGVIKEKQAARRIYETAKNQGRKTSLIEQQRPNLFTNSVANIGPGESITINIEYQQIINFNQGDFSLRFPTAITPRYIPGKPINESINFSGDGWAQATNQVPDADRITPPVFTSPYKTNSVSINIELDAGFPLKKIFSRYHAIKQTTTNNGLTRIQLAEETVPTDRDFELVWTPDTGYAPKAAVFNETFNNEHYQLLMMLPPDSKMNNDQALAREVTFIIDTSGSMHGTSIQQAKSSLLMALDRLRLHDKFNIIQFNSNTDRVFYNSKIASFENILIARQYVENLEANGGTEMAPALKLALQNTDHTNYLHQVVFLTDGSVGNETALFDIINKRLGNSRLFTIGIGSAPNSYFMKKAAQFGRGSFTYIGDVNEVSEKMTKLFKKLESPLMTDLKIHFDNVSSAEIWPQRIPDLYHGEPLVLAIKTDAPIKNLNLNGTRALSPWSASLNMLQGKNSKGIATFWARNKISSLMDNLQDKSKKESARKEIIDVAIKHHLVSKYTSLVAVDVTPTNNLNTPLKKHLLPVNLPHGQSSHTKQVFQRLPQTATNAEIQFLFGSALLLLGLLSQLIHQDFFRKKLKKLHLL